MNFTQICNSIGVENFDIKLAFRLGNRKEGVNKPLKVILDSKKTRTDIINNAKFIVNKAPERFKRVVISKGSYTVSERIQQKKEEKNTGIKRNSLIYNHTKVLQLTLAILR